MAPGICSNDARPIWSRLVARNKRCSNKNFGAKMYNSARCHTYYAWHDGSKFSMGSLDFGQIHCRAVWAGWQKNGGGKFLVEIGYFWAFCKCLGDWGRIICGPFWVINVDFGQIWWCLGDFWGERPSWEWMLEKTPEKFAGNGGRSKNAEKWREKRKERKKQSTLNGFFYIRSFLMYKKGFRLSSKSWIIVVSWGRTKQHKSWLTFKLNWRGRFQTGKIAQSRIFKSFLEQFLLVLKIVSPSVSASWKTPV